MNINTNQNHTTHLNVDPNLPIHQNDAVSTSSLPILTNSIEQEQGPVSFFERTFTSLSQSATDLDQMITVNFRSTFGIHLDNDFLLATAMNANQSMECRERAVSSLLTNIISDFHKWSKRCQKELVCLLCDTDDLARLEALISLLSNPAYRAHQNALIDLLRNPPYGADRETLISLLCNPPDEAHRAALIGLLCRPQYEFYEAHGVYPKHLISLLCNPAYEADRGALISLLCNPAYQANRETLIRLLCKPRSQYKAYEEALISLLCNPAYEPHRGALTSLLCNPVYKANRETLIRLLSNPAYEPHRGALIRLLCDTDYLAHKEDLISLLCNPPDEAHRAALISLLCNPSYQANRETLIRLLCNPAYKAYREILISLLCNPAYKAHQEDLISLICNPAYQTNRAALISVLYNPAYQANRETLISVLYNPAYKAHQEDLIRMLCHYVYEENREAIISLFSTPISQANLELFIGLLSTPTLRILIQLLRINGSQGDLERLILFLSAPTSQPLIQFLSERSQRELQILFNYFNSLSFDPSNSSQENCIIVACLGDDISRERNTLITMICVVLSNNPNITQEDLKNKISLLKKTLSYEAHQETLIRLLCNPVYEAHQAALIGLLCDPLYETHQEDLISSLCNPLYEDHRKDLISLLCNPLYETHRKDLISLLCNPLYETHREDLISLLCNPPYYTRYDGAYRAALIRLLCDPLHKAHQEDLISLLCNPAYEVHREDLISLLCNPAYEVHREDLISLLCNPAYKAHRAALISLLCNPPRYTNQENLIRLLFNPAYQAHQEAIISLLCNSYGSYRESLISVLSVLCTPAYETNRETLISLLCNPAYKAHREALISLLHNTAYQAHREALISLLCNPAYQANRDNLFRLLRHPACQANLEAIISLLSKPMSQTNLELFIGLLSTPTSEANLRILIQLLRINGSQGDLERLILFLSTPTSQPLIQFLSERSQEELEILFNYFNSLSFDPSNSSQENCIIVACLEDDISRKHRNTLITIICGVLSNNPNITQEDLKNEISLLKKALSYDTNNSQDTLQKLVALFKKMNSNSSNASLNSCRLLGPLIQPFFEKTIIDHLSSDDALFFDNEILKFQIETNVIPMMDSSACSLNFEQLNKLLDTIEKSLSQIQADDPQRDFLANFEKFYRMCYLGLLSKSLSQQEKKDFLNLDNIRTWSALAKSKGYTDSAPRKNSSGDPVFWMEIDGNQERLVFQTSHEKVIIHLNQSGACTSIMSGQQHIYEVRDLKPNVALEIEKLTQNLIKEIPCSRHGSGNLSVLPNGLAINPVFYLEQVAHILALNNQPRIHFLNPKLVEGPGTDAGGLSRQFFTLLCRHLTKNTSLFNTEDLVLPHMNGFRQDVKQDAKRDAKRIYCSLGMVMAYAATHDVVTGRLFSDETIRQVIVCASDASKEALGNRTNFITYADNDDAKILSLTQKLFPEMKNLIDCLQHPVNGVSVETLHSLCEKGLLEDRYGDLDSDLATLQKQNFKADGQPNFNLVEFKKQHLTAIIKDMEIRIIPLRAMGIGFLELAPSAQLLDPNQAALTSTKIQGQSFNRQVIADALTTDSKNQAIINKVQFLRNWILNSNTTETQIKQFIECCTGAPSLISNATIGFCEKSGSYPSFHTCFSSVDLNGSNETEAEFMDNFLKVMSWIGSSFDAA